jgi:hypothetical protein
MFRSRVGLVLLVFLAIATFFMVTEHTAHFFGVLPFLLVLACPLMMLFMHHGGHGGHADQSDHDTSSDGRSASGGTNQ